MDKNHTEKKRILAQFQNDDGSLVGTPFDLPSDVDQESLSLLCNTVLQNVSLFTSSSLAGHPWIIIRIYT